MPIEMLGALSFYLFHCPFSLSLIFLRPSFRVAVFVALPAFILCPRRAALFLRGDARRGNSLEKAVFAGLKQQNVPEFEQNR
jgi:hypothetical protein